MQPLNRQRDLSEGTFWNILQKTGDALLLGLLLLLCSLPIITVGASLTSFYYAMAKSVRHGRGYPHKEFLRSFRRVLPAGILFGSADAAVLCLLFLEREYAAHTGEVRSVLFIAAYDALILIVAAVSVWLFPVMSRFALKPGRLLALTFNIAFRNPLRTLILLVMAGGAFALTVMLPVGSVLILPAALCYAATYVTEPAMRRYIPETAAPGEDAWYLEDPRDSGTGNK